MLSFICILYKYVVFALIFANVLFIYLFLVYKSKPLLTCQFNHFGDMTHNIVNGKLNGKINEK